MKTKILYTLRNAGLLLLGSISVCTACSDDHEGESLLAAKTELTLAKYYNETASLITPTWAYDDQAVIYNASADASYASPILAGSQQSLFLFQIRATQAPTRLVSIYPHDAATYANGTVTAQIASEQTGKITPSMIGTTVAQVNDYAGCKITLSPWYCVLYVRASKGNYSIKQITVEGNNQEKIAGDVQLDLESGAVSASAGQITVTPEVPYNCTADAQVIPVMIAPVTLENGYTVTFTDTADQTFTFSTKEQTSMPAAGFVNTDNTQSSFINELVFCGSDQVYMIDADLAASGYKNAITWNWEAASASSTIGLPVSSCNHMDDCKPVDNNRKLLVTSSYNWCVLLDIQTKQILFYTTQSPNAHSAEYLPNNRIAVACSDGNGVNNDKIQIYDIATPNKILYSAEHDSAHGAVWNEATQRLYTVGAQQLKIFKLKDWESATPSLELERTVATPQTGCHDLTLVNSNTLCVGGRRAYLYNIGTSAFTELSLFAASTAIKSINYNDDTQELWYTDSTVPEGTQSWSTQTLRHASDPNGSASDKTIKIPDLDVYKVRVMSW